MKRFFFVSAMMGCMILMSSLFSGCGYRLGSVLPSDIKTIAVGSLLNKTNEPGLDYKVRNGIIEQLHIDGSLSVADAETADVILEGAVVEYTSQSLSYDKKGLADQFRLIIATDVTLKKRATGEVLWTCKRVTGKTTYDLGASQPESKRDATPAAIRDLAYNVTEKVVEGGW